MKRQIIEINEEKCIGCGLCANACHQGAIKVIDGKAKLISDSYCDGLGMCLPACPVDAIKLVEKDAEKFDESRRGFANKKHSGGCPSSVNRVLNACPSSVNKVLKSSEDEDKKNTQSVQLQSQLRQWPVQLKLISPMADFWDDADVLISADCCAYAYANFHEDFIKGKLTLIACPKLDDNEYYIEKLTEIFKTKDIKSITVVKMSVPCCQGIANAVKTAMLNAQKIVPYKEVTISPDGKIV
ncbi:4Fe-4S dicluster domain-containing protein [Alkalithermobacter thermoalcaliphilus JW-YL-7 = DSM 7308]|uniref:4Fe-4S dicluster domain-containing protein n=1 Tax=Alkalithermobacter thermoalcaliphilus JW-YL-7 = DSM 7308 TaxID=1121328 RepID=A0A150FS28_CLOPD|nr:4Fe-4S ferredoxin, iron-sulpur binding domain-containing protein [[Clostridium] paradoxum JW-YL-7 = DSM 7308]SHK34026.1 4Fe-4S dicluster domain-containing protein [[Clostridium] paradoxum JW-YL-7 = DSM 7308]